MRRLVIGLTLGLLVVATVPAALAEQQGKRQGPHCGSRFKDTESCSFRYRGGQLYLGGSVHGAGAPTGAAAIRLEARSHVTGERNVLLSCVTPASGGCAAGGSYETVEHLQKGQRLFCIVEGHGRGDYECGTLIHRRHR